MRVHDTMFIPGQLWGWVNHGEVTTYDLLINVDMTGDLIFLEVGMMPLPRKFRHDRYAYQQLVELGRYVLLEDMA